MRVLLVLAVIGTVAAALAQQTVMLTFDQPQTAGICGYRQMWDTPVVTAEDGVTVVPEGGFTDRRLVAPWAPAKRKNGELPGGLVMDAIHRGLLVRFPGVAESIAAQLQKRYIIQKAELVLPFLDNELLPEGKSAMDGRPPADGGYLFRTNWGVLEQYKAEDPAWHAVAWALRKPWQADLTTGPTYNAYINGAGYWAKYGAQDEKQDRFPARLGPAEVSGKSPEGRIDITATLNDPVYGKAPADRLRRLADCGFLLKKLETYDYRYYTGAYEWATGTGGHGLRIKTPTLVVTFARSGRSPKVGTLTPAVNLALLAEMLTKDGSGGKPTAVMPTKEEILAIAEKHKFSKPDWMPAWQWLRVQELKGFTTQDKGDVPFWYTYVAPYTRRLGNAPEQVYPIWLDFILSKPYRGWDGFSAASDTLFWNLYKDAMPVPVQEHLQNNWKAWSLDDQKTEDLDHPQAMQLWYGNQNKYYKETGDWRGNTSFYRDGYCYVISTMNFNHTSALGALLGGNIAGSERMMADGRHGLEYFPLRLWTWYDGTAQEAIDHYYYAITLSDQKMFADFGPTHFDRLMGQSCLAKSMDELISAYHPGLRHFISVSGRTSVPKYLLASQDGLQYIMHTMSKSGALHDVNNPAPPFKTSVIDGHFSPREAALQSTTGPWAPEWMANMVDDKPLPFEMTTSFKQWGTHLLHPLYRRVYMTDNYGLASADIPNGIVQVMGQWRRADKQVENVQDMGTMTVRCGINDTPMVNAAPGWMEPQGQQAVLQHKNKLITLTSPYNMTNREGVKSIQSTAAFYNFQQPAATWEIYIDGNKVDALPATCKQGQRITVKDGVTYIGIIPLPASNLGRTDEVVLRAGTPQTYDNVTTAPALQIDSYNLQQTAPLEKDAHWTIIDRAYGGFIIEYGDATDYKDFAAFQQHMREAKVDITRVGGGTDDTAVTYASGADTLKMTVNTLFAGGDRPSTECFRYRAVNDRWPYLPAGIDRDSNTTQMGTTGRLTKGGAVLTCEPDIMGYLQAEPKSGTYAGFNPLPDPTLWSLSVPGGVSVKTDGRVSLLRCVVRPAENKLWVDYGVKDGQQTPDMATALLLFGLKDAPTVEFNGKPLAAPLAVVTVEGQLAYVLPLVENAPIAGIAARYARAQQLFATLGKKSDTPVFVQDWYLVGPFYNDFLGKGYKKNIYEPEKTPGQVDLNATYTGVDTEGKEAPVRWTRLPAAAPLGGGPVNLLNAMKPNKGVCAFLYTKITSDRDRQVTLYTGSDEFMTVWLNGVKVLANPYYRAALKDQDKAVIPLKKGENTVLVKLAHGWEGWNFFFRLGDEFGFPMTEGITYGFGK
ncbi:MAG: hypothetical protein BWY76_00749 [bacterium ADurb.Bin429]|nr:MAG: hypothetical protein BWY76_00749 [bacterium ADurb.Bin429]